MGQQRFKVFLSGGEYVASCKYMADAAILAAHHGRGGTVRIGHQKWQTIHTVDDPLRAIRSLRDVMAEMEIAWQRVTDEAERRSEASRQRRQAEQARIPETVEVGGLVSIRL